MRGLTQSELAEKTGFQSSYISLVENRKRTGVSFEFLTEAARALNCRAKDLFEDPTADAVDVDLLAIIELWEKMPDSSRQAARAMLRGLAQDTGNQPQS